MRSRRPSAEHQEAVSRRLALLSAELAAAQRRATDEADDFWLPRGPGHDGASPDWDDLDGLGDLEDLPDERRSAWTSDHTRVRPRPATRTTPGPPPPPLVPQPDSAPIPAQAVPPPVPPPVPEPGRHAARRSRALAATAADLVPETLRGRAAFGSAQLTVVALVVALGLAVTCWWVVRGDAGAPVAPTPVDTSPVADLVEVPDPTAEAAPAAEPPTPGSEAGAAGEVVVDVAGKVRRPGIVVLDAGARVVDALDAAGGARPGVDLSSLNLARLLVDGEQVLVGRVAGAPVGPPAPGTGSTAGSAAPGAPAALVDINRASAVELEALPQVGPVTAAAIVAWRDTNGAFSSVDELLEVDGIGEATLAQVRPFATVGGG